MSSVRKKAFASGGQGGRKEEQSIMLTARNVWKFIICDDKRLGNRAENIRIGCEANGVAVQERAS